MKLTIVVVTPRKEAYDLVEGKAKVIASSNVTKKGYLAERNPATVIVGFLFQDDKAGEQLTSRILSLSVGFHAELSRFFHREVSHL
ncbi:MAG: hypothetical protein ABS40_19235 [Agrobacterium sp. SCN 61-19]|nr:MAG: hypothetical protein ABS40_19235 [Agrobacterium sp. SCN 61-19]